MKLLLHNLLKIIIEIDNGLFKILTNSNDNNKIVSKNKKQKDN